MDREPLGIWSMELRTGEPGEVRDAAAELDSLGWGGLAPHQAVVLERDPDIARATARDGIGMHIGFSAYQANLRRLGFGDDDLFPGDRLVAWGDLEAIGARLAAHHAAGADHIALHGLSRSDGPPVRTAWRELSCLLPQQAA
jgi:hypothetical protein